MTALMTFPFRVTPNGRVATAEQGSDTYLESQVRVIIGTRIGERDMCPMFGVPDPTFGVLSAVDIQTCADRFGPDDLTVTSVTTLATSDTTVTSDVLWQRVSAR